MAIRATGASASQTTQPVTLFLCGDVMTGRGIDQILPHPSNPRLFETYVKSAITYVELAERRVGAIPRSSRVEYVWGDALAEFERMRPHARIVNLETSVTTSDAAWPHKGIHYRMHPANVSCLAAAGIDCCVLANNHVMDFGRAGLEQTLAMLHAAGIRSTGAGHDAAEAAAPAIIDHANGARVLVFGFATDDSGVPYDWNATPEHAGVNLLTDLSMRSVESIARQIELHAAHGSVVVASIHWGGNWGYGISRRQKDFAHGLIDIAGVDLVHGHSSHHVKGIEVYARKAIFYGCGDFLNDYEGIDGHEVYRGDLALMYFPTLDAQSGELIRLSMTPVHTHHFRVNRAAPDAIAWLFGTMGRECARLGTQVTRQVDGTLALHWAAHRS